MPTSRRRFLASLVVAPVAARVLPDIAIPPVAVPEYYQLGGAIRGYGGYGTVLAQAPNHTQALAVISRELALFVEPKT